MFTEFECLHWSWISLENILVAAEVVLYVILWGMKRMESCSRDIFVES